MVGTEIFGNSELDTEIYNNYLDAHAIEILSKCVFKNFGSKKYYLRLYKKLLPYIKIWNNKTVFASHEKIYEVWHNLDYIDNDSYTRSTYQSQLLEYLIETDNINKIFVSKLFPIIKTQYILTKKNFPTKKITLISPIAFWKLITKNCWNCIQQILEITYQYNDSKFESLCKELCFARSTESCGERLDELDSNWIETFIQRTKITHTPMWYDLIRQDKIIFWGDMMWYLFSFFKENISQNRIDCCLFYWLRRSCNHPGSFPTLAMFMNKFPYKNFSSIYHSACNNKNLYPVKSIVNVLLPEEKENIMKYQILLAQNKFLHPQKLEWIMELANTVDKNNIADFVSKNIYELWILRLKTYQIGKQISATDIDMFTDEIELLKSISFYYIDYYMTRWYFGEPAKQIKIYRWFARLELFEVGWFTLWFDGL